MKTVFTNANVISGGKLLNNYSVGVENGKIAFVQPSADAPTAGYEQIDARGLYLSAGLIDVHLHGAMGHSFEEGTLEAFEAIASHHSKHGITSMLATISAAEDSVIYGFLDAYEKCAQKITSCRFLGAHLEGPYFSMEQRGAQNPDFIRNPSPEHYKPMLDYDFIKRLSAAPELDGALELGDYLRERGIQASMAHTAADFDLALQAIKHGYSTLTHIYSGMEGVHRKNAYRYGGLVEAGLLLDELIVEVIADNRHLPECLLKLIYKCKGPEGIILITDATRGAGFADGTVLTGRTGRQVIIEDGVAKLPCRTSFAGSTASGDRLIRNMVQVVNVPLVEAIGMMTVNPAKLLGMSDWIGDIKEGMAADIILFDEDIQMKHVMVAGVTL